MTVDWKRRKYTEAQFVEAWLSSESIAECARKLGLTIYGSTYRSIQNAADELGLSGIHMDMDARKPKKTGAFVREIPPDQVFVENSTYRSSSKLRKKALKFGLLENKCYAPYCPVPNPSINPFTGEETPLKLSIDHINGVNNDNRIENLRMLCYHCHGETETWCRGSKRLSRCRPTVSRDTQNIRRRGNSVVGSTPITCTCGNQMDARSKTCLECYNSKRDGKIEWPDLDQLEKMVESSNYSRVGRQLGVSDNAVRKALKRLRASNKTTEV